MNPEEFEKLNEKHPYLTYVKFDEDDLIGIIQNIDNNLVSIYVYNDLTDLKQKQKFLDLGRLWWDDSNHLIPINIFLREEFKAYKHILKCFSKKDVKELLGPTVNLEKSFQKRIKRKKIQLIRPMN